MRTIRIATRKSPLAVWQSEFVAAQIKTKHPSVNIQIIGFSTKGDEILDKSLSKIGGKGLFIKRLETALLNDEADIAVHSMKDVGAEIAKGLTIDTFLSRHSPYDAVIGKKLNELPSDAKIGTSSLRRMCQLKKSHPNFKFIPLRGNVNTRLAKLDAGEFDSIILAESGLVRIDLDHRITEVLPDSVCLPAISQGTIGVECRTDDVATQTLLASISDNRNTLITLAERGVNEVLNGSCQTPMAAFAQYTDTKKNEIELTALVMCQNSLDEIRVSKKCIVNSTSEATLFGRSVGEQLINEGADKYLISI